MRQEWYNYGSTVQGISVSMLRERLPQALWDRLLKHEMVNHGVCLDASDTELRSELDSFFRVDRKKDVLRELRADVDRKSLTEYDYYFFGLKTPDPLPSELFRDARTREDYARITVSHCPRLKVFGIRILDTPTIDSFERVIVVTSEVKSLFEDANVNGVQFVALANGLWIMRVQSRVPCWADEIIAPDYDKATQSVVGPYMFGLRYERSDFGPEDIHIIDRIQVGAKLYRYRLQRLVASRRFVELCMTKKVNRLLSLCFLFPNGMSALLVGRGRITSSPGAQPRKGLMNSLRERFTKKALRLPDEE